MLTEQNTIVIKGNRCWWLASVSCWRRLQFSVDKSGNRPKEGMPT